MKALIREALQIIEASVAAGSQVTTVKSVGAEGEVIEAHASLNRHMN